MASAWGLSWGSAWGNAWGSITVDPPDPPPGEVVSNRSDRLNLIGPEDQVTDPTLISRLYEMIESLRKGQTRNQAVVTLTANTTTTVVSDPLFESHQVVQLFPLTQDAAAEVATGLLFVSDRTQGGFTITHSNSAAENRTFGYIFVG